MHICKSYCEKISGTFFYVDTVYIRKDEELELLPREQTSIDLPSHVVPGSKGLSYIEHLRQLGLRSLEVCEISLGMLNS